MPLLCSSSLCTFRWHPRDEMSFWMLLYDYHPGINLLAARLLGWLLGNRWLGRGFSEALPHWDCWMSHPEVARSLGFRRG